MIITVNGDHLDLARYESYHGERFRRTLSLVKSLGGGRTVELGGHPFAMTARLLREPSVKLVATVSAEEVTAWPDDFPVTRRPYLLKDPDNKEWEFNNVSGNLERMMFPIFSESEERADLVLACEILEHLIRAPHVLVLNINSWLNSGGRVVITTPNGSQFENPLRLKQKMPSLRYSVYARHNFLFTMPTLCDLLEKCGFEIEIATYWSPYRRSGLARLYRAFSYLPGSYFKAKFAQTLVVVARKVEERTTARALPKALRNDGPWEYVEGLERPKTSTIRAEDA